MLEKTQYDETVGMVHQNTKIQHHTNLDNGENYFFRVRTKEDAQGKRSDVDEHIASFSLMVRDHCMAMPDRLAPAIAAVHDTATVHRIMKTDIDAALRKLSKAVASAGF